MARKVQGGTPLVGGGDVMKRDSVLADTCYQPRRIFFGVAGQAMLMSALTIRDRAEKGQSWTGKLVLTAATTPWHMASLLNSIVWVRVHTATGRFVRELPSLCSDQGATNAQWFLLPHHNNADEMVAVRSNKSGAGVGSIIRCSHRESCQRSPAHRKASEQNRILVPLAFV